MLFSWFVIVILFSDVQTLAQFIRRYTYDLRDSLGQHLNQHRLGQLAPET